MNQYKASRRRFAGGRAGSRGRRGHRRRGLADELRGALARAAEVVAHDAKLLRLGRAPADDTLIAAYLVDPGRAGYELDDLAREHGLELVAGARRGGGDGCPRARTRSRRCGSRRYCGDGCASSGWSDSTTRSSCRSPGARRHGGRRNPDRHVSDGGDHRAARRAGRGARGERARARGRGVPARLDAAARANPLREARAHRGPQGEDGLLDRRAACSVRSATTTRSCRSSRSGAS